MSSILKIEFEKLRKTKSFWAIMLFLVFITSTVAITRSLEVGGSVGGINPAEPRAENGYFFEDNSAYAISLYNVWIGSISGDLFFTTIFYFILPLAATLPFSFSLSDESKSGYLRQMTLKKGQMRYYFAKYIVTFTSGFLLAAIPLLINVIITACYIPAYKPDPLEQLYSGQYYGQYLANIFYGVLSSISTASGKEIEIKLPYPLIYMDKEKEIDRNMPYKIAVTKYPSRKYIQFG